MFVKTTATEKIVNLSKRIRAIQGGSSASKTISILLYLIALAQSDTERTLTSVVSESMPHIKKGAMRDFKNIMQDHNYWNENRWNATDSIYTFETGSKIEFFGAEDGSKLRGARRDRLFINEANNVPLEAFEQLEIRTKDFIFLDWNPTNEFWFYTDVLPNRKDVDHLILTYKDNEALSQNIISALESRMNRKSWWRVYGLGLLGDVEGKIYKDWNIIDEIPFEARLERYGLDFGYTNDPTAIVAVYYYNGGYILDEIAYSSGLLNKDISSIIKDTEKRALVIADSAEPKSIDDLKFTYMIDIIGAEKGQDSIRNGIEIVQAQRISVTRRSVNILKEYRNYLWKTDKDGKYISPNIPEDGNDHMMDAIRYAITSIKRNSAIDSIRQMQEQKMIRNRFNQEMNSSK